MAVFYGGVLALEVAAGQDLGSPGFKSTRIEIRNGRGQIWLGVALVRPVLVPALGADKAGGLVADLAVVEIEVRAQKIDHDRDNARLGELVEPVVASQRLIHHADDIARVEGVGRVPVRRVHEGVFDVLGPGFDLGHQAMKLAAHLLHLRSVIEAFEQEIAVVVEELLLLGV